MLKAKTQGIVMFLLAVSALALGGCGSADVPSASSLVGSWTGTPAGYGGEGEPKMEIGPPEIFIIKVADDATRSFAGKMVVSEADAKKYGIPQPMNYRFVGEVTPWGEIEIEGEDGHWTLRPDGDDKLVGSFLEAGRDLSAKSITLTRVN
jgi:hypothetical protein